MNALLRRLESEPGPVLEMDESTRQLIADKRVAYEAATAKNSDVVAAPAATAAPPASDNKPKLNASGFPPGTTLCAKCNAQTLVLMDGCQTCLNCGYSKCG